MNALLPHTAAQPLSYAAIANIAPGDVIGCWYTGSFDEPNSDGWIGPFTVAYVVDGLIYVANGDTFCPLADDVIAWPMAAHTTFDVVQRNGDGTLGRYDVVYAAPITLAAAAASARESARRGGATLESVVPR